VKHPSSSLNPSTHIWLRCESKRGEERTALTPRHASRLVRAGYRVTVERNDPRSSSPSFPSFLASDYSSAGCELADPHSWKSSAPPDAIILGLKELEVETIPLPHKHIHFAHIYKGQRGWQEALRRFDEGGGALYDLEYLVDDRGRRVAAFGRWAGFAGAALSLMAWANQQRGESPILGAISSRPSREALINDVRKQLDGVELPQVLVLGALGRSGQGALELCKAVGVPSIEWDLAETKSGGPFPELLDVDVLVNCVYVQTAIPPFVTDETLHTPSRKLGVICDVSCDPYGDCNPLPIYSRCTSFENPTMRLIESPQPLDLIAIDHLPSLLPVESSEDFCSQLMPYLLQSDNLEEGVWRRAFELFQQKCEFAKQVN